MDNLEVAITPRLGIGNVRIGMNEAEVVVSLENAPHTTMITRVLGLKKNTFHSLGIRVWYDSSGKCDAIEAFGPARPTLFDQHVLGRPVLEMKAWIANIDPEVTFDDNTLTSFKLGVGFYAPQGTSKPSTPVEGVIVFEDGYYGKY